MRKKKILYTNRYLFGQNNGTMVGFSFGCLAGWCIEWMDELLFIPLASSEKYEMFKYKCEQ